ncbi:ABC transporter permease, partial [Brevundimonas sp. WCHBH090558]|nr:ABC transporter permease [Brevundimonas huaxiensis]
VLSAFLVAALGEVDMAFSATAIYSGAAIAFSNGTLPLDHGPRFARIWSDILPYTHYLRLQTGQLVTGATSASAWRDLMILSGVTVLGLIVSALFIRVRARLVPKPENLNFPLPQQGVIAAFAATFRNLPRARPVSSLLILAVVLYAFYYPAAYAGQAAT